MRGKRIAIASLAFVGFASGAAAQSADTVTAERFAAQCIHQTRAPGSYEIVYGGLIPRVAAGRGATQRGAANVNDCLADRYQVQPNRVAAVAPAATAAEVGPDRVNCAEILSRSPGASAGYAFTSSFLFGAIGAGVQANIYQRNLQTCLAQQGGIAASVGGGRGGTFVGGGCGGGSLMVGGSRYCSY